MNPPRDICRVSWDDVQYFCQHSQFLDTLCGPRCPQTTGRANVLEAYNWLSRLPGDFPEFVMLVTEKVTRLHRESILTWNVIASDAGDGAFFVRVTVYLK